MGFFGNLIGTQKNFPSNENNRKNSLIKMATNRKCSTEIIKQKFSVQLIEKNLSAEDILKSVLILRSNKSKESIEFKINEEDTCAAFMETWTQEIYDKYLLLYSGGFSKSVKDKLVEFDPKLKQIVNSGNTTQLDKYLDQNPEISERMMEDIIAKTPTEKYLFRASIMKEKNDFLGELLYLGQALNSTQDYDKRISINEDQVTCFENLNEYEYAISYLTKSIEYYKTKRPIDNFEIFLLYQRRSDLKDKMGDFQGKMADKEKAAEYMDKF